MIDEILFYIYSKLINYHIKRNNFKRVHKLIERKKKIAIRFRQKLKNIS